MTIGEQAYVKAHFLKTLKHIYHYCDTFINFIEHDKIVNMCPLATDNDSKFKVMEGVLNRIGTTLTTSLAHTSQSNGSAERMNHRHLDKAW